jgi:hypothetical protein
LRSSPRKGFIIRHFQVERDQQKLAKLSTDIPLRDKSSQRETTLAF